MDLIIGGPSRAGKDSLAKLLEKLYGLTYSSSSWMAKDYVWRNAPGLGAAYHSAESAWHFRHQCRDVWYRYIQRMNTPVKTTLGRMIFDKHDIYVGVRDKEEFYAMKGTGMFTLSIWVSANERLKFQEDKSSMDLTEEDFDISITNNGLLIPRGADVPDKFKLKVQRLFSHLQLSS